jgi:hypothetical protein
MKNILSLGLVFVIGAAVLAQAAPKRSFPNQKDGSAVAHPLYGGYSYFLETNATESMVCTGKCLLAGFYRSTGAEATSVKIRGTAAIGGTDAELMFPPSRFHLIETDYESANPVSLPVLSADGISVELSSVAAGETVVVIYLDLDD